MGRRHKGDRSVHHQDFLPHDATYIARTTLSQDVCPSVPLSVFLLTQTVPLILDRDVLVLDNNY